ncbi:MAG: hypothetical protein OK449_10430 [Thaumarchaeota archaeon]|nr:hypothetical protein [Nitrososphaerota archaeon]
MKNRRTNLVSSGVLPLLLLILLTLGLTSSLTYALPSAAAAPPSTTIFYLRSSTNALGGAKVLNQIPGPTNCNIAGSKCISEPFACLNPLVLPCPNGVSKDFVSPALAGPLKITMIAYTINLMNNNPLITLNFKLMFNLTKNGATIYSQTSDLQSLKTGASAAFGILIPGNAVPGANQAFAKGDVVDCSVNVVNVQDNSGKPRSATDLSLLYNGKVDSGADSRCTITTDVCPTFMATNPQANDQAGPSCPIPITGAPEFGLPVILVAAAALVMVVFIRRLSVRSPVGASTPSSADGIHA